MKFESPITELDLEIRTQKTKDSIRSALMDGGVPWEDASQYSEDWARKFVEQGLWPYEALETLRSLAKEHLNDSAFDIYPLASFHSFSIALYLSLQREQYQMLVYLVGVRHEGRHFQVYYR